MRGAINDTVTCPQTWFIFDGDLLIGEVQNPSPGGIGGGGDLQLLEMAGPYDPQAAPAAPFAAYTWGAAGLVSERLFSNNASYWYHYGPQGETRCVTNGTGTSVAGYLYSAYGLPPQVYYPTDAGTGFTNHFVYGGQFGYYTDFGWIILCGARWYDPAQGRWLSRDPIGYGGGSNLYEYCSDDPVNFNDPNGMDLLVLYGDNKKNKGYFLRRAQEWVKRNQISRPVKYRPAFTVQQTKEALRSSGDIDGLVIFAHGGVSTEGAAKGQMVLFLSEKDNLSEKDIVALDTDRFNTDYSIALFGCHTGDKVGGAPKPLNQMFADRFRADTLGTVGKLAFGNPHFKSGWFGHYDPWLDTDPGKLRTTGTFGWAYPATRPAPGWIPPEQRKPWWNRK